MKILKRMIAVVAIATASLLASIGIGGGSAGATDNTCQPGVVQLSSSKRLLVGDQDTIGTIPDGAIISSVVVQTSDTYPTTSHQNRQQANQKFEQVVILVGGIQLGGPTTDVPEVGADGSVWTASQLSTVFAGSQTASGKVVVRHAGGGDGTPNSVMVPYVKISYGCQPPVTTTTTVVPTTVSPETTVPETIPQTTTPSTTVAVGIPPTLVTLPPTTVPALPPVEPPAVRIPVAAPSVPTLYQLPDTGPSDTDWFALLGLTYMLGGIMFILKAARRG